MPLQTETSLNSMELEIRKATIADAQQVHSLYSSRIGAKGCTWDEEYPTLELVQRDIQRNALYAVYHGDRIAAAAVCAEDRDLRRFDLWSGEIKNPCELERVGILEEYQGMSLASRLLRHIEADMISQGYDGILLLVDPENDRARALYEHLGFSHKGEREGWEHVWSCYEKQLTVDNVQ